MEAAISRFCGAKAELFLSRRMTRDRSPSPS